MNKQEANAKLAKLLKKVQTSIDEAESLANEFGLTFDSPVGVYGMGGTFYGKGSTDHPAEDWYPSTNDGWQSSSASC